MALLRAAAAQRALAAQRAGSAGNGQAPASNGATASGGPTPRLASADTTRGTGDEPVNDAQEPFIDAEDLTIDAEDLAAVDEVADADVLPAGAASDPGAAQAVIAGLAAAPRRMTLQHGDEAVDSAARVGSTAADPGAKLGRNDPCWCGSGLKYKKCHGR